MLSSLSTRLADQTKAAADMTGANPLTGMGDILSGNKLGSFLGGLSSLFSNFGGWRSRKTTPAASPAPTEVPVAAPVVTPKPWESGVNSTYANPFGASPDATTFASMLSRQPTL